MHRKIELLPQHTPHKTTKPSSLLNVKTIAFPKNTNFKSELTNILPKQEQSEEFQSQPKIDKKELFGVFSPMRRSLSLASIKKNKQRVLPGIISQEAVNEVPNQKSKNLQQKSQFSTGPQLLVRKNTASNKIQSSVNRKLEHGNYNLKDYFVQSQAQLERKLKNQDNPYYRNPSVLYSSNSSSVGHTKSNFFHNNIQAFFDTETIASSQIFNAINPQFSQTCRILSNRKFNSMKHTVIRRQSQKQSSNDLITRQLKKHDKQQPKVDRFQISKKLIKDALVTDKAKVRKHQSGREEVLKFQGWGDESKLDIGRPEDEDLAKFA